MMDYLSIALISLALGGALTLLALNGDFKKLEREANKWKDLAERRMAYIKDMAACSKFRK
jgi:hypothetical protein